MTFAHGTAALGTTVQWLFDLLVDVFRHGTVRPWMTEFSTGAFVLVFGNFFAVAPPKGGGLSGTGTPLLSELLAQGAILLTQLTILVVQGCDGWFQRRDTLQQRLNSERGSIQVPP